MKLKIYISLFIISLSHFAFGQDSLVKAKGNANLIATLGGNYTVQNTSSLPPIYKNTYVLSQHEKDSFGVLFFPKIKRRIYCALFRHPKMIKSIG